MIYLRDGKLIEHEYEMFQTLIDEDVPVWKRDIAEMQKLYVVDNPHERKDVKFTKYAHFYLDYDHEWLWLRDQKDEDGAFFLHKDDKFTFIAAETAKMKPAQAKQGDVSYLRISGSAGGPSQFIEIYAFKNGKRIETFTALLVAGEVSECSLNGKEIGEDAGQAYLAKLPSFGDLNSYFKDIETD